MAKILATEIRVGNLLELDKKVWRVLKSYHVHVGGRGGAYMQIEIKDIETGQKRNERLSTDDRASLEMKLEPAASDSGLRWLVRHDLVVPA